MSFSDWQIDRLRARLSAYQLNSGKDGYPRPWLSVTLDILECDETDLWLPEDEPEPVENQKPDKHWPIKQNDLQKFVMGVKKDEARHWQVPETHKLEAVRQFLEFTKYLGPHCLDEHLIPYHAAYSLIEFLGRDEASTPTAMASQIQGEYEFEADLGREIEKRHFVAHLTRDKKFLRVREVRLAYRNKSQKPLKQWDDREKNWNHLSTVRFTGWATVAQTGLTAVFLRPEEENGPGASYILFAIEIADGVSKNLHLIYQDSVKILRSLPAVESANFVSVSSMLDSCILSFERTNSRDLTFS